MIIETKAYRGCLMRRTKKSTRKTTGMVRGRVGNALAIAFCAFERVKEAPARYGFRIVRTKSAIRDFYLAATFQ